MIQSMTGFGRAESSKSGKTVRVEIKSLNSKGFDLRLKIPEVLRGKEIEIRNIVQRQIVRGKIDLSISFDLPVEETIAKINPEVANSYNMQLQNLSKNIDFGNSDILNSILRLPNVLEVEDNQLEEEFISQIFQTITKSCNSVIDFRKTEGELLETDIIRNIAIIEKGLAVVKDKEPERIDAIRERLRTNLEKVNVEVDEGRFEQEIIYYLDKLDLNEEFTRLSGHCNYFREVTNQDISQGKKLGFISQEIGREINTIGSKANNGEIQKSVVGMKDALEQIKEQLANVL